MEKAGCCLSSRRQSRMTLVSGRRLSLTVKTTQHVSKPTNSMLRSTLIMRWWDTRKPSLVVALIFLIMVVTFISAYRIISLPLENEAVTRTSTRSNIVYLPYFPQRLLLLLLLLLHCSSMFRIEWISQIRVFEWQCPMARSQVYIVDAASTLFPCIV